MTDFDIAASRQEAASARVEQRAAVLAREARDRLRAAYSGRYGRQLLDALAVLEAALPHLAVSTGEIHDHAEFLAVSTEFKAVLTHVTALIDAAETNSATAA